MTAIRLAVAALAALSVASGAQAAEKFVAITQIVEHPALDACRKGVKDVLAEAGFVEGKTLKWEYESAQGNMATAVQIARKFVGDNPDAIVTIATPSSQAAVAATKTIPVVFSAVTDPVSAKLVSNWEKPGGNVTGTSDMAPVGRHLEMIKRVVPGLKRLGFLYNPGEVNSVSSLKAVRDAAKPMGIEVLEGAAPKSSEVLAAARSLVGKVDAFYVPTDNTVVSAYEAVVKVGIDSKVPVFASDTDSVERGAIAALGFNYYEVGRQTGEIVVRILKGEKPGDIPVSGVRKMDLWLNLASAAKMGVKIPDTMVAVAVQDPGLFDWAIAALRGILDHNVDADGSLPFELKRAGKAMHYHRFSLEPLVVAAEIAAANGIDLYAENNGALHRLAAYTAAAMRDPDLITRRLGVTQSVVGSDAIKPAMWAWAEPYLARFPDRAELATAVAGLRGKGLFSAWMGGDMTLRFGRP